MAQGVARPPEKEGGMKLGRAIALMTFLGLAGCGTDSEEYLKVFRAQKAAWEEIAEVLAKIEDEKGMAAAKEELGNRLEEFDSIARRAKLLPEPSDDVRKRLEQERFGMQRAADRLLEEVRRVKELPGGEDFFREFEGKATVFQSFVHQSNRPK